ncbi:M23 family metallopeptidase [Acuticoccus kandeliae]|uniref:M23 family metallopeptidase n=1 Tax=Acuticoccus kandeliae TaxID=2073160 RepID=UPI000D3EDD97|nr:M23 family metallopeptidase [Acuticoccus kandeliae]
MRTALAIAASLAITGAATAAEPIRLGMPVDCVPGETCFVQKYVDVDPTEGMSDYLCGHMTNDGHKGTDFRPLMGETFDVIAPADGTMLRGRDGVPNRDFSEPLNVDSRMACGNGVILDLGGGWQSQICHLEPGSLRVRPGQALKKGDVIGVAGASGLVDFRHVHVQYMKDGKVIDPFTGLVQGEAACGDMGTPLWDEATAAAMKNVGETHIIALGFNDAPVTIDMIENGRTNQTIKPGAGAFVAYGLAIGVEEGDEQRLVLKGPGFDIDNTEAVDRPMAQSMRFGGRRLKDGLEPGTYEARMEIVRDGAVISARDASITID